MALLHSCALPTLAQTNLGDLFGGANVPRIPDPPLVSHRLFEEPLPLVILLGAAAILVWFILGRAGKARQGRIAGGGVAVVALLPLLLAAVVRTDRELLIAGSKGLIDGVAAADVVRIDGLLAQNAEVRPFDWSRDAILAHVGSDMQTKYKVKEHEVLDARASLDGPNTARTQLHVRVVPDSGVWGGPIASWWIIHWQRFADDKAWRIVAIECQQIDGIGNPASVHP